MAWDNWEELQRKRAEAERQDREKRRADEQKRAEEDARKAKERKAAELKEKAEREEKRRQQVEQANAVYEEALNGSTSKRKNKQPISLNKFCGMRAFGFSRGGQQSSGSGQPRPALFQKEGGDIPTSGGSGAKSSGGGSTRLMTAAWLSGSRRYRGG